MRLSKSLQETSHRKFFFLMTSLLFIFILAAGCGSEEMKEDEFIVFTGQGVNNVSIGDLGSKAAGSLGSGYTELFNNFGDGDALFYMQYSNLGIQIAMKIGPENSDVESLRINRIKFFGSFSGMTEEGIRIGSTLTEVQAIYGIGDVDSFGSHSYDDIGIFFNYDQNDEVEDFTVYTP